jgi:hypothetical protein
MGEATGLSHLPPLIFMANMKNLILLSSLMVISIALPKLSAQNQLQLQGIVIDQQTQSPIPFAHIGMPSQGIGTVSSEQGRFSFTFPESLIAEPIEISHIGHFTTTLFYQDLAPEKTTVTLRPHAILLEGVEVLEAEYPLSFYIQKAISNLNKNYPSRLHFMSGFYRETKVNAETLRFDRLVEAAVDIQDKGLKSSRDNVRIHIRELRKSDDFSDYSELNQRLKERYGDRNKMYDLFIRNPIRSYQNEETPLSLKYNLLELMRVREDQLKLREVTYKDKTKIYVIDYQGTIFSGTLYIDSEDYGIHRLELYTDNNFQRLRKSKDNTLTPIDRSQLVGVNKEMYRYQKVNGTYHLSLVQKTTFDDFLDSQQNDNDKIFSYAIRTLMINDFFTNKKAFDRIKWKETAKRDLPVYDIDMPYHEDFWATYNMLQLEPLDNQVKSNLEWASRLEVQFKKNGKGEK